MNLKRKLEAILFKVLMISAMICVLSFLFFIIITIFIKGIPAMNLAMLTQTPKGGFYLGKEGGILNAILGSIYLATAATILATLISLPIVFFLNGYLKKYPQLTHIIRLSLEVLSGIPSIVYGAFGLIVMLFLGIGASLLGGIITVALLILPILCRALDEILHLVPNELVESSYALGATRWETSRLVLYKQIKPGLITAILIAFGRGISDAASVMFTAGFTDHLPNSLLRPVATLPLAIFFQLTSPIPEVQARAYASAIVLIVILFTISLISRHIRKKFQQYTIK